MTKAIAMQRELSAEQFRSKYFTEYKTAQGSVFILQQKALKELGEKPDHPTSIKLCEMAGLVPCVLDTDKLIVGTGASFETTIRAFNGKQPLSFGVVSDDAAADVGRRFGLSAYGGPHSAAPVVVGVPLGYRAGNRKSLRVGKDDRIVLVQPNGTETEIRVIEGTKVLLRKSG